ncbi:MAG TPA: hypothetical protein VN654_28550 [Vicinamibacterales bacterium]|nr:hypothetical protein [Vicinamibacterales bacterium]
MSGVSIYELRLTGFDFPTALPNDKANFRIVGEVRYITSDGGFATDHVVLPGLDTFWECALDKSAEPNYVRAEGAASFDMNKVDAWDGLMLMFKATAVHSVKLTVFDVNRQDAWDKIKDQLGPVIEAIVSKASAAVPAIGGPLGGLVKNSLGDASADVQGYLLKRLAGGGDKVLFKGSARLHTPTAPAPFVQRIAGQGTSGRYSVEVTVEQVTSLAAPA